MRNTQLRYECPWPGAQPYEVDQARFFFGRQQEIEDICRLVLSERLTVLSGPSGSGKTSLLRAGIMPALLDASNLAKRDPSQPLIPPILMLREWGTKHAESVEDIFQASLDRAIGSLTKLAPHDYAKMVTSARPGSFFDRVVELCDKVGGVILIFDQFEEVLRAGDELANEVVKLLVNLYRFERRARMLLSLRQEHLTDLRRLDAFVQGLLERAYFLPSMMPRTVEDAILSSAEAASFELHGEALATIMMWLSQLGVKSVYPASEPAVGPQDISEDGFVDLLTLQTILRELFEECSREWQEPPCETGMPTIDLAALELYKRGRSTRDLVGGALARWIERSLTPQAVRSPSDSHAPISRLDERELTGALRRQAARIAPFLSSGGFKISADELDLLWRSIRGELRKLQPTLDHTAIRVVRDADGIARLDRVSLEVLQQSDSRLQDNLSGMARQYGWNLADTADYLVQLFYGTLESLAAGNVVKSIRVRNRATWELVHDGLGPPFVEWGEMQESTWDYSLFSPTASRGQAIRIDRSLREEKLNRVVWQGCSLRPAKDQVLIGTAFEGCDLRGTVFRDCTFEGGVFRNCVLDGTIYIDCRFERGPDAAPVLFHRCQDTSGLTFRASQRTRADNSIAAMRFENCQLDGLAMVGVTLDGPVQFSSDTELFRAHFSGLCAGSSGEGRLEFADGCQVDFCAWDKQSEDLIVPNPPPKWPNSGRRQVSAE